jgi:hypothetical protein
VVATKTYINGIYEGEFLDDRKLGEGTYTYNSGEK